MIDKTNTSDMILFINRRTCYNEVADLEFSKDGSNNIIGAATKCAKRIL
jgi:hypothetical protein